MHVSKECIKVPSADKYQRITGERLTRRQLRNSRCDFSWRQLRHKWRHWPIHHNVGKIPQQLLGTVLWRLKLEQLWVFVNEIRVKIPSEKLAVLQNVLKKWNICLLAVNTSHRY